MAVKYGYLEPISLEVGTDEATIHYTLPTPLMESTQEVIGVLPFIKK